MVLLRKCRYNNKKSTSWTVAHEGRHEIGRWKDERLRLNRKRRSYYQLLVYYFSLETLKNFLQNINGMILIQLLMAMISVYAFQSFNVSVDIPLTLVVSPIIFPLAFSINSDFDRRENVLEHLATFKSSGVMWYFCMREWREAAELDDNWITAVRGKLKSFLFHLGEYLLTYKTERRKVVVRVMYEDFSDANQLIEELRASKLPANTALVSKSIHLLSMMCQSFERLRGLREYRSPRSIRSFTKVFIICLPILLAPYFVHLGIQGNNRWGAYYIAGLVAFVYSALQGIQDRLDDPFGGVSEDDINLDTIDEWTSGPLEYTMKRSFNNFRLKPLRHANTNSNADQDPCLTRITEEVSDVVSGIESGTRNVLLSDTNNNSCNIVKCEITDNSMPEVATDNTQITTEGVLRNQIEVAVGASSQDVTNPCLETIIDPVTHNSTVDTHRRPKGKMRVPLVNEPALYGDEETVNLVMSSSKESRVPCPVSRVACPVSRDVFRSVNTCDSLSHNKTEYRTYPAKGNNSLNNIARCHQDENQISETDHLLIPQGDTQLKKQCNADNLLTLGLSTTRNERQCDQGGGTSHVYETAVALKPLTVYPASRPNRLI